MTSFYWASKNPGAQLGAWDTFDAETGNHRDAVERLLATKAGRELEHGALVVIFKAAPWTEGDTPAVPWLFQITRRATAVVEECEVAHGVTDPLAVIVTA